MKRTVDYGREPGYAALPIKIVCQSNRPAQVKTSRRAGLYGTGQAPGEASTNACYASVGSYYRPGLSVRRRHQANV